MARPFTLREIVNVILTDSHLEKVRNIELLAGKTVGDVLDKLVNSEKTADLLDLQIGKSFTLGQVLDALHAEELTEEMSDVQVNQPVTVGKIVDFLKNNEALQGQRDRTITLKTTVGEVMDFFGEENVKNFIQEKTAAAAYKEEYAQTAGNIIRNWLYLCLFILVFAMLSTIVLELIDKDKR